MYGIERDIFDCKKEAFPYIYSHHIIIFNIHGIHIFICDGDICVIDTNVTRSRESNAKFLASKLQDFGSTFW